jgi:hypothetical protein
MVVGAVKASETVQRHLVTDRARTVQGSKIKNIDVEFSSGLFRLVDRRVLQGTGGPVGKLKQSEYTSLVRCMPSTALGPLAALKCAVRPRC